MEDSKENNLENINDKNNLPKEEELKDFADSDTSIFQMMQGIQIVSDEENNQDETKVDDNQELEPEENNEEKLENASEEIKEEDKEENKEEDKEELSPWEELGEDNNVYKKFIFYVSKDFAPRIDELTQDERTAYINDAIQKKLDLENEQLQNAKKKKLLVHFLIMFIIFCFATPVVLFLVHKSIMVTFENYKYSQDNFEKLYKQRFEKDKAYMRSVKYNKRLEEKMKKQVEQKIEKHD